MVLYSTIQLSPRRFQLYRLIVTCHDHKCLRCHLFSCDRLHALGITSKESTSILCLVKHITFYCSFQNKSPRIFYCRPSCILSFIANNVSNKHTCSSCEYWKKVAVKATTWSMQRTARTKIPEGVSVEYFFSGMENFSGQERSRTYLQIA